MFAKILLFLLCSLFALSVGASTYSVTAKRLNSNKPVISSQTGGSIFTYNYNCAWLPLIGADGKVTDALLVRSQNSTNKNKYSTGPSVLTLSTLKDPLNPDNIQATPISAASIVLAPTSSNDSFGTEDPRVVYREQDKTYYLLYSAVQNNPVVSRLSLATSQTPTDPASWKRHGPLFPDVAWSKSGALLLRDGFPGPHYLFWGDSTGKCGLTIATSTDLVTWKNQNGTFLPCRSSSFDRNLIEAGPMPLPLSDGNYLFIYNSDRPGYPSEKPGWNIQYNVGWAILDQTDPTKVLQRSETPLLSPELEWENGTSPYLGLTPNVVFLEGWKATGKDTFIAFYGAADSVVGAVEIDVEITAS